MTQQTGRHANTNPPIRHTPGPPTRSTVAAALAALAGAACCALPVLIAAGVLTGAGAALAQNVLLAASGVLIATAGLLWWLGRHRTAHRTAEAAASGDSNH
jgi:mercuric ion transport protein